MSKYTTKEQRHAYNKSYYQKMVDKGMCPRCGKNPKGLTTKLCSDCIQYTTSSRQERLNKFRLAGLCMCGERPLEDKKLCERCRQKVSNANIRWRADGTGTMLLRRKLQQIKQEVFAGYGNKCACCGETRQWTFQLDHVYNNGAEHRRSLNNGKSHRNTHKMYQWAVSNKFPNSLQILCANCNFGKALSATGQCPHEIERYCIERNDK